MSEEISNRKLHSSMRRAARTMFHRGHKAGRGRGHRRHAPSQERVLSELVDAGGVLPQNDLLEILNIRPSSLSELLTKVEEKGFIARSISEEDRRSFDIQVTTEGREKLEEVREVNRRRDEELFGVLTDTEREQLMGILDKLSLHWQEVSEERKQIFQEKGPHPKRECGKRRHHH